MRKADERKEVEQGLISQLEDKGVTNPVFYDLVKKYMTLWDISERLEQDIRKRGVTTTYNNGGGQTGYKKNDSIQELNKIIERMQRLLVQMDISVKDDAPNDAQSLL